jgi:hypothetical protein
LHMLNIYYAALNVPQRASSGMNETFPPFNPT